MAFPKRVLQIADLSVLVSETFDGRDRVTVGLHRKHQARPHRFTVEHDRARPADTVFTSDMGTCQTEYVPKAIDQRHAGRNSHRAARPLTLRVISTCFIFVPPRRHL